MDVLDFHAALVRFPSLSGQEHEIATFAEATLRAVPGLRVGRHDDNVWAEWGTGDDVLLLVSHLDVVPPSADHPYPPFEPTQVDGRIYGRGAVDAKASGAAMTAALVRLAAEGWTPPAGGRLVVALTACEETGAGYNGMEAMRRDVFGRTLPDVRAALVGEPTALRPCLAQKGLLILDVTARGQTAHAARAHLGANALTAAARDLLALDALRFAREDPLLGAPTATATMLTAGTARNVVPDRATFCVDVRSTPAYSHAELAACVADALEGDVSVYSDRLVPCRTAPDARVARAAGAALAGLGLDRAPFGSPTASDWVFLADVPAVKIGPGRSELSHTAEEHVDAEQVLRAVDVYAAVAREYFADGGEHAGGRGQP